jgi:hypothetical protein
MMRRVMIGLLSATGVTLSLAGCGVTESRYRQKITVEVETPSGTKTGSSVVEVGYAGKPAVLKDIPGNGFSVRGEAVAVEVAAGRVLFALLAQPPKRGGDTAWYQAMLFGDAMRAGARPEPQLTLPGNGQDVTAHAAIGQSRAKVTVPSRLYPLLVTFGDIRDPKSVMRVDPGDLAATLGPGVRLKAITLQVTDDPVTTGIEKRFSWWGQYRNRFFDGTSTVSQDLTSNRLDTALASGSFSTESNR